ncbi:MAG: methylmalonyl-CoA mutase [Bacteroidota bacterium]|nr:methylmalonyl-CoA mutase [Bacteroidota bacterium]
MFDQLFEDFDAITTKQWKQKIQFELNGADYNQTLIWNAPEDIKVKPFYHNDEFKDAYWLKNTSQNVSICQNIFVFDVDKSIERALESLKLGSESLRFSITNESLEIEKLLEKLPLNNLTIYFNFSFLSLDFIQKIEKITQPFQTTLYYNFDPIGQLAVDGNWFSSSQKTNFDFLNLLASQISNHSYISINVALYQNAGANMVQQIAYGLAHALEYFCRISKINTQIVFEIAVGSNFFFEIAKLRAFRVLFDLLAKEYQHELPCHLVVFPSKRNKTLYANHVNSLRTTTECLSAILGGADALVNQPFDALFHKDNQYSNQLARNQLLFLKKEFLNQEKNPVEGSFYLESLTTQLADKALVLIKEMEAKGGFLKLLQEGVIKNKIQASATKEQELFDAKNEVLVGSNRFANRSDRMKESLELFPFVKTKARKTLIIPIIERRLSEKIEQMRLESE